MVRVQCSPGIFYSVPPSSARLASDHPVHSYPQSGLSRQGGRHLPLQLLPEHGAVSAPLGKPRYGLRLHNSFTGIANCTPPGQVIPVSFIIPLLAHRKLLRTIRSLVCAGEVANKCFFKVQPAINTALSQVVQPNPGWPLQHLRDVPHRPSAVSSRDMHCRHIICQPVLRLSTTVICLCTSV